MLKNLTDFNPDGWDIGQSPTDKIAFYGAPPISQRPGGAQSPLLGMPGNQFVTYQFSLSPSAVGANTTVESTFTGLTGILTTDFIVAVNKPSTQAGLGLVGWRNSATTAGTIYMNFANSTGSTITPTASETYNVVVMRGGPVVSQSITPAAVPAGTTVEQVFILQGSGAAGTAIVNAAGQVVGVNITAGGSGYFIPPSVTFAGGGPQPSYVLSGAFGGLDQPAATAAMPYGSGATGIAVVNSSGVVTGVKITNPGSGYLAAPAVSFAGGNWFEPGQFAVGSKPSSQTGLGIGGWRVPATGQIGITYTNYTGSAITPTAGETYQFLALNEMPPMSEFVEYGATITTPGTSITSSSTAEQAIPLTGITAGSDWVAGISKPSVQTGLFVGGARVSVTTSNSIYVCFGNVTGSAITPTGSEVYVVTVGKVNPPMPAMVYPQYISSFTSVAANTSAEQNVTLQGGPIGSTMVMNYVGGSLPTGLSIGGVRVSATTAGVVYVNWQNNTSSAMTPPAGLYLFGNFPVPGPGVGNFAAVLGSPAQFLNNALTNEVQQLLDAIGLYRGY
jgi:hypothetical protein